MFDTVTAASVWVRIASAPLNPLAASVPSSAVKPLPASPEPSSRVKLPWFWPTGAEPFKVLPAYTKVPSGADTFKLPASLLALPLAPWKPETSTVAPERAMTLPSLAMSRIAPPAAAASVTV